MKKRTHLRMKQWLILWTKISICFGLLFFFKTRYYYMHTCVYIYIKLLSIHAGEILFSLNFIQYSRVFKTTHSKINTCLNWIFKNTCISGILIQFSKKNTLTLRGFTPRDYHRPVLQYRHWMPIPESRWCHSQCKILLGLIYTLLTNSHRVHSSLVLHIPLFSLFTFPLVRFDNQLNEGEVFTEAVCLLPTADFRGGSCVATWGLMTRLLCWRLVLSPGTKFWKNKVRTWLDTNTIYSGKGSKQ